MNANPNPDRAVLGNEGLSFEQWAVALSEEIKRLGLQRCYGTAKPVKDDWYCYFDDGMSPKEAIEEDLTNL